MADEINKKITINVGVNTDGQQQINQYKVALDNLLSLYFSKYLVF